MNRKRVISFSSRPDTKKKSEDASERPIIPHEFVSNFVWGVKEIGVRVNKARLLRNYGLVWTKIIEFRVIYGVRRGNRQGLIRMDQDDRISFPSR